MSAISINKNNFREEVLNSEKSVLLDFFADWCGPCQRVLPVIDEIARENPDIKVVAVEPAASPVLSEKVAGAHKIQGIGAGFVPEILDTTVYDEIIKVDDEEAFEMGRLIGKKEGVLVGISAGAALCGAIKEAEKEENAGKTIVVILPDSGDRYLSTPLFEE